MVWPSWFGGSASTATNVPNVPQQYVNWDHLADFEETLARTRNVDPSNFELGLDGLEDADIDGEFDFDAGDFGVGDDAQVEFDAADYLDHANGEVPLDEFDAQLGDGVAEGVGEGVAEGVGEGVAEGVGGALIDAVGVGVGAAAGGAAAGAAAGGAAAGGAAAGGAAAGGGGATAGGVAAALGGATVETASTGVGLPIAAVLATAAAGAVVYAVVEESEKDPADYARGHDEALAWLDAKRERDRDEEEPYAKFMRDKHGIDAVSGKTIDSLHKEQIDELQRRQDAMGNVSRFELALLSAEHSEVVRLRNGMLEMKKQTDERMLQLQEQSTSRATRSTSEQHDHTVTPRVYTPLGEVGAGSPPPAYGGPRTFRQLLGEPVDTGNGFYPPTELKSYREQHEDEAKPNPKRQKVTNRKVPADVTDNTATYTVAALAAVMYLLNP